MKLRIVHLLLLQSVIAGMEGGRALAEVLFGRNASSFLFQSEPEEYGYIGRTS